jgi:hypothetical protein
MTRIDGWNSCAVRRLLMVAILVLTGCGSVEDFSREEAASLKMVSQAHTANPVTYTRGGMPFSGAWDRFGLAHPSSHHTPYGGDWATDLYATSGTPVYFHPFDNYTGGTYVVSSVAAACRSGIIADGGHAVKVELKDRAGTSLGWVLYSHLDRVPAGVANGQPISSGALLGYTRRWNHSTCYQVSTEEGVHVHYEAYNHHNYACYWDYGSGQTVASNRSMGLVGAHGVTTAKTACQSTCGTSGNSSCNFNWAGTSYANNCPTSWNGTGDGCDCGCQFIDKDCGCKGT